MGREAGMFECSGQMLCQGSQQMSRIHPFTVFACCPFICPCSCPLLLAYNKQWTSWILNHREVCTTEDSWEACFQQQLHTMFISTSTFLLWNPAMKIEGRTKQRISSSVCLSILDHFEFRKSDAETISQILLALPAVACNVWDVEQQNQFLTVSCLTQDHFQCAQCLNLRMFFHHTEMLISNPSSA